MAFRLLFLPFLVAMVVAEAETCDSDIRMAMETETVESLELLQVKAKDKTEDAEEWYRYNPPGWRGGPGRGYSHYNPPGWRGGPGHGYTYVHRNPYGWRGGPGHGTTVVHHHGRYGWGHGTTVYHRHGWR